MIRTCGACLALLAFAVTILRGLEIGNPPEITLVRALWAMGIGLIVGAAIGWVGQAVVEEHNRQQSQSQTQAKEKETDTVKAAPQSGAAIRTVHGGPARSPEGSGVRAGPGQ